ncbi:MAG TPA: 16S rRNA (guanine(966)-N(2))-methyltransferase RsmD [Bryobacteraceae bacterium]|nr:16S rRNA (guanine(966)-N(2))-methyltransferase RsmD [Bryobacteraceae bacterium]
MRVIAGEFRSRRLASVEGLDTRPTPDRLRETLFNILGASVEGCVFLDAYAGTGAVGIEALSRGARRAVFLEKSRKAAETIRKNLESLKITGRASIIQGSAHLHIGECAADIVFLDPPYEKHREYQACLDAIDLKPSGIAVFQHSIRFELPDVAGALRIVRQVKHGDNALSFYKPAVSETNLKISPEYGS